MKLPIVLAPVETGASTRPSKSEKACSKAIDVLEAGDGTPPGTVVPHNKEISGNTNQFRYCFMFSVSSSSWSETVISLPLA